MVSLEQKIKEYVSSVEIPDRVKPEEIRRLLEDNGDMTAGVFLRKLKELKISGSDFLELLGNSKIGNMEFRRIEENPHLKFDELLQILPKPMHRKHPTVRSFLRLRHLFFVCRKKLTAKKMSKL